MKKNLYHISFLIIFGILIFPQITFAVWWNPFSWFSRKPIEKPRASIQVPVSTTTAPELINVDKKPESIIVSSSTPVKKTTVVKKELIVVVSDPKSILIAEFLKNPTLENFKVFCDSAKNIEGSKTKQVLNSNREQMVTIKLSFYYDMQDCQIYDEDEYSMLPLDNNLLVTLSSDDTDGMREAKIIFNDKVKNTIVTSKVKFIYFRRYPLTVHSPTELFRSIVDIYNMQQQINMSPATQEHVAASASDIENTEYQLKQSLRYSSDAINDISSHFL